MNAFTIMVCLMLCIQTVAQQPDPLPQLEEDDIETSGNTEEEDDRLLQLHAFRRNPLDLNQASPDELQLLGLNAIQVLALIEHRQRFGPLIAIQELQAVKGWDLRTIRALLPYVFIGHARTNTERIKHGWKKGSHFFLWRFTRTLERSKGYTNLNAGQVYAGSPQKILFRYQYKSPAGIQSGITTEKDAGEAVFGKMKTGIDFTSAHIQIKNVGMLQTMVVGDYKVQTGQGLLLWQSNGFRRGAGSLLVKRQGPLLVPYTGAGEYLFSRGAAIEFGKRNWKLFAFYSNRKLTANLEMNEHGKQNITTILQTGLHRSVAELNKKNNVSHRMFGVTGRWVFTNGHVSINTIRHFFPVPFAPGRRPYSYNDFAGRHILNGSLDYGYTRNNFHTSGEFAIDQSGKIATVNNIMLALDSKADVVLLYRDYPKKFASFQSNPFGENGVSQNERGLYAGLSLRPEKAWQVDAYADLAMFPWFKFRADAPSSSSGYALLIRYVPSRKSEWYIRFRKELSEVNVNSGGIDHFNAIRNITSSSIRMHLGLQLSSECAFRQRIELTRVGENKAWRNGGIYYAEAFFKPSQGLTSYNFRMVVFDTEDYDTRIYMYEQDVLFTASVPALDGRGFRYYFNVHRKLSFSKKIRQWKADVYFRFAQTIYFDRQVIGSGMDEINGNHKSEFRIQFIGTTLK